MAVTVGISSLGMFSNGHSGWGFQPVPMALTYGLGVISLGLSEVDGKVEPRQVLNLAVKFDHLVIDGAPAARFTGCQVDLIESGYGFEVSIQAGGAQA